ncbi:hypothetical protein FHS43_002051 [Streptosporangium becharense]|uniref:ArsR family transcriptional regulator n=1 Tax=Streptosporangium becharense TaxID=1816182 RepID=A0A7W9MEQ3_9ACTN|nr:hypothetical protein [Streptosporangium becharense]MBB5817483.1 hypothetical protein [Streptosporangium becharense]
MSELFHASAAPARRRILDALTERDGQTLFELCAGQARRLAVVSPGDTCGTLIRIAGMRR